MVKSQGTSGKDLQTGQALKILDEWRSEEVFLDRKQKTANVAKVAAEAELLKQKQEEEHVAKVAAEAELLKQKQHEEYTAKQDLAVGIQQPAKVLLPLGVHEQLGRKEAGVLDIPVDESQKQQQQQQPQQQERAAQPVTLDITLPEPLKQMQGTENRRHQPTDVELRKQKQDNGLTEDFSLSKGKALT